MNNTEEIPLDEDEHVTLHGSALLAQNAGPSIPVARNTPQAIPNSHDVHIVAAALGSYVAEEQPAPPTNQRGIEAQKESKLQEQAIENNSSSEDSSSDEDESSVCDESEEEIHSYSDLKELIDNMTTNLDTHDTGPQPSAAELLFGNNNGSTSVDTIQVNPSDEIVEAGRIANCIEGTVIVTASADSHLLGEGSILVTADRKIVGPVEDIFGPVQSPMYILRDPNAFNQKQGEEHGGASSFPALAVGAVLYSVPALSTRILEDDLRVKGYDADDIAEIQGDGDPECEFSDDEAVRCCFVLFAVNFEFERDMCHPIYLSIDTNSFHDMTTPFIHPIILYIIIQEAAYKKSLGQAPSNQQKSTTKKNRRPRQRQSGQQPPAKPTTVAEFYAQRQQHDADSYVPVSFQTHHAS